MKILSGVDFRDFDLKGIDFSNACLLGSLFQRTDCRQAKFKHSDCRQAIFDGACLDGADFQFADLRGASFWGVSNLKSINFANSVLPTEDSRFYSLDLEVKINCVEDEVYIGYIKKTFQEWSEIKNSELIALEIEPDSFYWRLEVIELCMKMRGK